jgi:hypothetical protein
MSRKLMKLFWIVPLALLGIALFLLLGGEVVKWLWNWLLPPLFGWRELTFWQALGLLALCRILFGGHGLHGSNRSNVRRRVGERIEQRIGERTAHMSPEEREEYRQKMRERWGFGRSSDESKSE